MLLVRYRYVYLENATSTRTSTRYPGGTVLYSYEYCNRTVLSTVRVLQRGSYTPYEYEYCTSTGTSYQFCTVPPTYCTTSYLLQYLLPPTCYLLPKCVVVLASGTHEVHEVTTQED